MECKKCKAQLEPGVTRCPECGTENAPKTGITFTPGKLVLVIAAVVVLTALVVALIMQGMGYSFSAGTEETTAPTDVIATEPAGTIPADGNPDDVTCKGSYTVSDEEAVAAMDTVVATLGDVQLTNSELQIYYWTQVQQFLSSEDGYYLYYYGALDYTKPLDTQVCYYDNTKTWQQYLLEGALSNWHTYQSLAQESLANGFELSEEYLTMIESLPDTLATDGGLQGFESAEEYLAYNVGPGASIAAYQKYMQTYYQGYMYFQTEYEKMVPTDEELQAYFTEHEAEYAESGITKDGVYVDVRHILVLPEGATVDTIYTETFSDEAWAVGEQNANDILNRWLSGEATEESFAALANETSADPGSNTMGGLYQGVATGEMVEEFDAWCFDETRKVGDYGIVKTNLGYHIMYFSGSTPIWKEYALGDILNERGTALIDEITAKYSMEVDNSAISLGYVDMGA